MHQIHDAQAQVIIAPELPDIVVLNISVAANAVQPGRLRRIDAVCLRHIVVHLPLGGNLHQVGFLAIQHRVVGLVIAPHGTGVGETHLGEDIWGAFMPVAGGGAVAHRGLAGEVLDNFPGLFQDLALLLYRLFHKAFVGVAVIADLMARTSDAAHYIGIALRHKARYEKGRLHAILVQQVQDHVHAAIWAVLSDGSGTNQLLRIRFIGGHIPPDNISVQIKGKHCGAFFYLLATVFFPFRILFHFRVLSGNPGRKSGGIYPWYICMEYYKHCSPAGQCDL